MAKWKGIVGREFSPDEFEEYVETLVFPAWRPSFVVVHNTGSPKLSQWHSVSGEQRMKNLEHFYRDTHKWSAGPHLFVADDLIWVFTHLTTSGVHSPSWNAISWGVEMVGDYSTEAFDTGSGAKVRDNAVSALATLHAAAGIDSHTIHFHKEDPKTTHNCPGINVQKSDLIQRVHDELIRRHGGDHPLGAVDG